MRFYVIKFFLIIMSIPFTFKILYSDNINSCMKKAIKLDVELNKILTMCRENIENIESIDVTFEVSKPDKSREVKLLALTNIRPMPVTFEVSKLDKSR